LLDDILGYKDTWALSAEGSTLLYIPIANISDSYVICQILLKLENLFLVACHIDCLGLVTCNSNWR